MTQSTCSMLGGRYSRRTGLKPSGPGVFFDWKWAIASLIVSVSHNIMEVCHDSGHKGRHVIIKRQMVGGGVRKMRSEKEIRSLPTRTREGAVGLAEGGDTPGLSAVEDPHESASFTGARSPFHVSPP